jgi:hypothetical protein
MFLFTINIQYRSYLIFDAAEIASLLEVSQVESSADEEAEGFRSRHGLRVGQKSWEAAVAFPEQSEVIGYVEFEMEDFGLVMASEWERRVKRPR